MEKKHFRQPIKMHSLQISKLDCRLNF